MTADLPGHERPFVLDVPARPRERQGQVDFYLPDQAGQAPAVLFVHGPLPEAQRPTPRDWPVFTGYARLVATLGSVGVTVDHRLFGPDDFSRAAQDLADAVELVRRDPRVDADKIALWFFSGSGLLTPRWLADPPAWLRCLAMTYPLLAPASWWGPVNVGTLPSAAVEGAGSLPIVLTRVGLERPEVAATVADFLTAAAAHEVDVEIIDVPNGHHAFDLKDYTDESRKAVVAAVRSVLGRLGISAGWPPP